MNNLIHISEAAAIGLHAMTLLINEKEPVSAFYIAEKLGVSKHHLSKVLRFLVVSDLLTSVKGPKGGFILSEKQTHTTFMQILEAVDGPKTCFECLFVSKPCSDKCILKDLLRNLNKEFFDYFNNTKVIYFKERI